eukprot:4200413-Pyramimonas_sp.AAC.1
MQKSRRRRSPAICETLRTPGRSALPSSTVPSLPGDATVCFLESTASRWAPWPFFENAKSSQQCPAPPPHPFLHRVMQVVGSVAVQMPCVWVAKLATRTADAVPTLAEQRAATLPSACRSAPQKRRGLILRA